jgi:hypothetical protein
VYLYLDRFRLWSQRVYARRPWAAPVPALRPEAQA